MSQPIVAPGRSPRRQAARRLRAAAAMAALAAVSSCSSLTEVQAPDIVTPDKLETPQGAQALMAGGLDKFATAFVSGSGGGQAPFAGVMADEFTVTLATSEGDRRVTTDLTSFDRMIHEARGNLMRAIGSLQRHLPEPASRIGRLFSLVGYTEIFFAETFCSGVPLSEIRDGEPVIGSPLTTTQMLEQAAKDFDSALVYSAADPAMESLARVGLARALLNLDRPADAAAAVASVPTSFVYNVEYSSSGPINGYADDHLNYRYLTVSDHEGINGLDFRSAADPRVPTEYLGVGYDRVTPAYGFSPFMSLSAPVPLATGIEARLIEAEAALRANPNDATTTGTGWLGRLNDLRATAITPALPPLADPGTPEARVDLLFRERAFWLFATGHRLGDLRRLVRQYGRDTESVFPTGPYGAGGTYGTAVNYVPSRNELNNPNYTGCLSLGA
ncbi:MAG TPA: hypothetical protein VFS11_11035 [Gemmatimonadales bacterium]|nr:hypothetical protein [Gemmatimonadales bacterium]